MALGAPIPPAPPPGGVAPGPGASGCSGKLRTFLAALQVPSPSVTALRALFVRLSGCSPAVRTRAIQAVANAVVAQRITVADAQRITGMDVITGGELVKRDLAAFAPDVIGTVLRVGVGALGATLIIVGLIMIAADTTLGNAARKLGAAVATKGRAA